MQAGDKDTRGQGVPSSPSRTRSSEPQVMGEVLADDARTATPPRGAEGRAASSPVADARVGTPPRATDAGGASTGDHRCRPHQCSP
jgi:hypothetical protein